jgi:KilA-N domain
MSNIGPVSSGKLNASKAITDTVGEEFKLRGRTVRVDGDGFVCLNDIHHAAGFSTTRRPFDWYQLPTTGPFILAAHARIVGQSKQTKIRISDVYRAASATSGGTWAHPIIAASYAGYLKPELEVEMREVWLRFKAADPTLADELLQRATDEQNEWVATRALGRAKRNQFTETLKNHSVTGYGYGNCTNAVYREVLGGTTKDILKARALPEKANLRDQMSKDELVYVMMAETLARERIEDEKPVGNSPCERATRRSASFVRQAIDLDRKDRQKPLDV